MVNVSSDITDFRLDRGFLLKLNEVKVREYLAAIVVLDFATENVVANLIGKVVSGSMSINAQSPTRRTGSLQIVFDDTTKDITDIDNLIAIDKKIRISIGFKNPFYNIIPQYTKYGEDLFFPQGMFLVTGASSSIAATGCSVTMQFTDKMALLNGTAGGALPASVSFHESVIIDKDGNQTTEYPLIKEIVREAVHHFGNEEYSRIIADDIPLKGRQVVAWNGDTPIWFQEFKKGSTTFIISNNKKDGYENKFSRGQVIGYKETDLTYPGELIQNAGSSVQALCDTVAKTLGNFEYFYDIDGNFRFQTIANYDKTGVTPLMFSNDEMYELFKPNWNDDQFIDEFATKNMIISINQNPNYANIKNDFICWGTRQDNSSSGGSDIQKKVRYHLAIDQRPKQDETDLCRKFIYKIYNKETEEVVSYKFIDSYISIKDVNSSSKSGAEILREAIGTDKINTYDDEDIGYPLYFPKPHSTDKIQEQVDVHLGIINPREGFVDYFTYDWREELYRRALNAYESSQKGSDYDEELIAEWREIFDPSNEQFHEDWHNYFDKADEKIDSWRGYNPVVQNAPNKLRYWLDFIDSTAPIGQLSVKNIGRRTLAWEDSQINEVYSKEVNDVVFVVNPGNAEEAQKAAEYYINQGQTFSLIRPEMEQQMTTVNSYGSCVEAIRQKLNENLYYNTTVQVTCIPMFYLDVNKIIRLNYPELGISGDFIINSISWQISHNATMSLSCNQALTTI